MKKTIALLLILAFLLPFAGCGQVGPQENLDDDSVTVTDQAGRTVVIEATPQRIISCYYITTSLLMALGLGENIVGIENEPHLRPIYGLSQPHLLQLPWVGTAKTLDLEACAALEPDLVILPLRLKDAAEILEDLGIDVLLVNPESQELLIEMIQLVAAATNTEDKAEALIDFIDNQEKYLTEIRGRMKNIKVESLTMNQESLAECLYDSSWWNPFPKFKFSERPDTASAAILEGNIVTLPLLTN